MKHVYCLIFLLCGTSVFAQGGRGAFIEKMLNEQASFGVRVDVDRSDRTYVKDDLLQVTVKSSEDGYLYLFYRNAAGKVSVLFPNKFHKDNFIRKNETLPVPALASGFQIRIDAPFGAELLKAVVSKKQLTDIGGAVTQVTEETGKLLLQSLEAETSDWAEHHVRIQTTFDGGRRFAVAVGIGNYKDDKISNFDICRIDAEKALDVFTKHCGVKKSQAFLLTNENATLANIRKVIKEDLPKRTRPGDTVFLYWSGHGGWTQNDKRGFLIPYDGLVQDIEGTMLMSETFGRWIQELDGRKVLIVLDTSQGEDKAGNAQETEADTEWKTLGFAFKQLAGLKDIGQKDVAIISSCALGEGSYSRRERDLSVFTYYVLLAIKTAKEPMTHARLCEEVKPLVSRYVEQNFSGRQQTVVMQDDMTEPLVLNP